MGGWTSIFTCLGDQDLFKVCLAQDPMLLHKEKDIKKLHEEILTTPGVVETGIFYKITDLALIIENGDIGVISL